MTEPIHNEIAPIKGQAKRADWEVWLALAAIVCIIAAGIIGYTRTSGTILPALKKAVPTAHHFERVGTQEPVMYVAYDVNGEYGAPADDGKAHTGQSPSHYICLAEAIGYGGPLTLAVATDLQGDITGLAVVEHRETPSWFTRVADSGFLETVLGKSYHDAFELGNDLDGVTGATYTARAIAQASLIGSRGIAGDALKLPVPPAKEKSIVFGVPEMVLVLLFIVGFIGHRREFAHTNKARWFCMLLSFVVLGVLYTQPLTISYINQFLLGFWPDWHNHLFYYMLLGGTFLVLTIDGKNPYCMWFCPFGAVQECMGKLGGAKVPQKTAWHTWIKWAQRGLAFTAIIVALVFRNPGLSSYEIFGTFFDMEGSMLSFFLLGLVLLTSLFIRRPWCTTLCPIPPIESLVLFLRKRVKQWTKK